VFARPGALVGQTRLAIIDLVSGDPPITNEDATVGVALNGEIYNYKVLGDELRRDGHTLATRCDTEVIAHLAEHLDGTHLARRLDGMFAFAVWDDNARRLTLGRDRVGKKPLYYWATNDDLVFGSEIKAVLAHPLVSRDLDPDAIPGYLTFGYVPTPRTFFAGIVSVPPGHVLTFEPGRGVRLERYWEPRIPGVGGVTGLDLSPREAAQEVRTRLTAAVERRMIADVPLGAFLSGGIDSSTIVGIMAGLSSRPVRTFTIGFEDTEGFDERPYARLVAERFATEHVEFVVNPNAVDLIERLIWHHDQPFGDSSALPTFLLSELTRGHVTVALCGDGGDELFAGYERFAGALLLDRFQHLPTSVRTAVGKVADVVPPSLFGGRGGSFRRLTARAALPVQEAFLAWVSIVPEEWRHQLLGTPSNWALDDYRRIWETTQGGEVLDRLLALTIGTYLLDDLLPKVDRMSMAHGLETRSPLLDHRLIEFALRLPSASRVRGMSGKRVLKRAVHDLLPDEIVKRRKRGFGVPLDRWFRTDLKLFLDATLGAADARVRSYLKPDGIDAMLAEHRAGQGRHRDAIWALLTLELFLRREDW
jgi:asparagine synthase (glutamine-hydrolysing)